MNVKFMEEDIGPRQRLISRLLFSFRFINIKGDRMKMQSTGRKKRLGEEKSRRPDKGRMEVVMRDALRQALGR